MALSDDPGEIEMSDWMLERYEIVRELRAQLGLMPPADDDTPLVKLAWEAVRALEGCDPDAS